MPRIILCLLAVAIMLPAHAQLQVTPARTYGAQETKKKERIFPIFWSAARKVFPPLPFNPFPELPLYDAGNNNLIYDDREVDYPALEAAMAKERAQAEAEAAALEKDAGGGGMALRLSSSSTNLTLATPLFDGTNVQLTIQNGVEDEFYDLFYSTNLVDWHFYVRTDTNQFSFAIAPPAWPVCFFRLGTQLDTDDDSLTDAYELLVAQTSPTFPDSTQTLGQYTNLNTFQISNNWAALTDHPPVLKLYLYERDYSHLFLDNPCPLSSYNSFDSHSHRTRWTNEAGGFFTNSFVQNSCPTGNVAVATNHQREGRIMADISGTNQIRSRLDNGAWSAWTNDVNGLVPHPGGLLVDQSYRRMTNMHIWSTTPPERYLTTDITTTRMRYSTRGPLFSTAMRLHKITVGANDYTPGGTAISNALISILGLPGNTNGEFYVNLRDNRNIDLTPTLPPEYTNYTYAVDAGRVEVRLKRGGSNITDTTQTVWVGQQMDLECEVSTGSVGLNYSWVVPGTKVADWQYSSTNAVVIPFSTNRSSHRALYYWVDKNPAARVECTVTLGGVSRTVRATFDVRRPQATWTLTPHAQVQVTTNHHRPGWNPFYALICGSAFGNDVGMSFEYQVTNFDGYSGSYQIWFVQTVRIDWKANQIQTSPIQRSWYVDMEGLDTDIPYLSWSVAAEDTDDSPGDPLPGVDSYYYRRDRFKCYLMFKPTDGPSIPVPLSLAEWQWMGQAILVNTNTVPVQYSLHPYYTSPQATTSSETLNHPTWTNNAANYNSFRKWNEFWYYPATP